MAILFDAEKKIFKLDTASSSYVFAVHDSGRLLHLYYGAYLPDCDMRYLLDRGYFVSFTPDAAGYVGTEFPRIHSRANIPATAPAISASPHSKSATRTAISRPTSATFRTAF